MEYLHTADGLLVRPDIRYEKGEDVSEFPLISILDEGKTKGVFKGLHLTNLVSLTGAPILMLLRIEQILKIKYSKSEVELLIQACLQAVKA